MSGPAEDLARAVSLALRSDFPAREATALQLAELLLDAVAAALPLTDGRPAESALVQLEGLASSSDVYAWDGAPGWDEVLQHGLLPREPISPGPSVLDGLGAGASPQAGAAALRDLQRGELKRRARAEAARFLGVTREIARFPQAGTDTPLEQAATLSAPGAVVAAHASLLRLIGHAAVSSLLLLDEAAAPGALPGPASLEAEIDSRPDFAAAQEEWLAMLLAQNQTGPAFRTFFAGASQWLRAGVELREFRDAALRGEKPAGSAEALFGVLGGWQPMRWSSLRAGAPGEWLAQLCPPAPPEAPLQRLARECSEAMGLLARLFTARGATEAGFSALASLFVARCASLLALWEEL